MAGVIASTHETHKGIAHGAPGILDGNAANWSFASLVAATDWAISKGARIINWSWGGGDYNNPTPSLWDYYADYIVFNRRVTVVVAAGNYDTDWSDGTYWPTYYVSNPGLAYNVITVGAINDFDTDSWDDDRMCDFSCYEEFYLGDREKPELVAVGEYIHSTITSSPWISSYTFSGGTSYAAPAVAGAAALIMQQNTILKQWPETVKAILMASAVHNIEDYIRLSEKDGVGALDLMTAYETVNQGRFNRFALYNHDVPKTVTFSAWDMERVRIVITWFARPDQTYPAGYPDALKSDLDLIIKDKYGNIIANSSSFNNNYEIVDFLAPYTGTYTAIITSNNMDLAEIVGFARSHRTGSGGGGCPLLSVWNGSEYVREGLLDIHNPDGIDVIRKHTLITKPQPVRGMYLLRLTEHPKTHSYIDQVKLFALLNDEILVELPLIWAWHSEYGNVLPQLLFSDEWKTETKGAQHNNGTSQSIDLKFLALPPNTKATGFIFQIEGNNEELK